MTTITKADRDAAKSLFRDDRTGLSAKFSLGANPAPLLEAFARRGEAERARIAAWLVKQPPHMSLQEYADAIERGDFDHD